jgi:squalene synthase HpnC
MTATRGGRHTQLFSRDAVMAQAREENFPVASLILGPRTRRHLLALYGFARLVDDTGDEAPGDRGALLGEVGQELSAIFDGGEPEHPVMRNLRATVRACELPEEPFRRLLEANLRDQALTRYETFDQLLDYCHLSAAPVGELVLDVFGVATPPRIALSDRICAGLQVIEHLQDVAEDYARGRIYLPAEDLAAAGVAEAELLAASASPALRRVISVLAARSALLLDSGPPLLSQVGPRLRLPLAGFVAGGRATIGALDQAGFDVLGQRPRRTRRGFAVAMWQAVRGR